MPYDPDKKMIHTKLTGVSTTMYNPYGIKEIFSLENGMGDPMVVSFASYVTKEDSGKLSKNYTSVSGFTLYVDGMKINEQIDPIKRMSTLLSKFTERQSVLMYISNYPERVLRFYRMDKDVFVRFNMYSDYEMTDEWTVNYFIGNIDKEKYAHILDNSITGIVSFNVTGVESKKTNSSIKLGLNISIKIYD
jgi:hypothetical protein